MTRAELKAEIVRRLEESSTTPVFYTEADIEDAINDGLAEISDATEWDERYQTIDLLADRPWYDGRTVIGAALLTLGPAFHVDTNRWLRASRQTDLDRGDTRWERVVGPPQRVLTAGVWWFSYWPRIGSATGTVKQYFTALPDDLDEDTDEPGFPEPYHYGLVEYAVYDLFAQEGESAIAMAAWAEYVRYEMSLRAFVEGRLSEPLVLGYGAH